MSHNIRLSNVKIKDLDLLGQAASELSGGKAVLDKTAKTFRTYAGQPSVCDAKIGMPGRHDIGLSKNSDGSYSPLYDPYSMDPCLKSPHGRERIGGLLQEYALREAEYEAAQRGMTATRVAGAKGMITLELVAA